MMGSSSSWSAQNVGSSSFSPGAGFGQTMGSFSSTPCGVSEKGSRVSAYAPTADGHPDLYLHSLPDLDLQSISAMPVYCNKSHEELRHEDYEKGDRGGDSLQKSITPAPMFPMSSSSSVGLSCSSTPSFTFRPATHIVAPFPESPAELQPSARGPNSISNPYHYLPLKLASMGIQRPPPSHTEFQKNPSTHCPSLHPSPFTAHVRGAHSASASTLSMQGTFSQSFPTTSTQPGKSPLIGSSVAHSEPAVSSHAHCTSVNVDYPNNTVELHLPVNVRLVRIRFSSSNDGAGTSQVHSDHVAKASEAPISVSIYPGENLELTIQTMERTAKSQMGKQSSSTGGSDHSNVHNSSGHPPSRSAGTQNGRNGDAHLTQISVAAPEREVITGSVLPRLYNADYYTVPSIVELAVKESDEPGYCSHVPDFTVGRHGYGSVRFDGETDVRKLDIASIVEFNNREILVYRDESKTPPVGQGLNKPAEVTLLNVKCIDEKTGLQFTRGPMVDLYKEILVQWTKEHDAEFVSFDPVKGEWKFKVKNFSQ